MKQILSWNGNQKLQNIRGLILYQIEMKESEIMEKELKHQEAIGYKKSVAS